MHALRRVQFDEAVARGNLERLAHSFPDSRLESTRLLITDDCPLPTPSRRCSALALALLVLAGGSVAVAAMDDTPALADAGKTNAAETRLAMKLHNPIADLVTVPLENNFEFSSDSRHALTYTLNVEPVVPLHLTKDWLLVTRTIIPFISQEAATAGERNKTGLGDINQSLFLSPAKLEGGWIVGGGPVFQYPTATRSELGTGRWGAGPTLAVLQQDTRWTFGVLANQVWSFAGDRHRELVNTALVDPFISYTWPNNFTVEFDAGSTYDWKQRQWAVPLTAGVSQLVTIGKQSVSFGLDGRWYAEHASGTPAWGVVFTVTFLFPKSIK